MDNNNETNNNGYGNNNSNYNNNNYNPNGINGNPPKRLYRSNISKMLCGVCGGIGNYFNIDPTIIRLLFVLFGFFSFGTGIFVYFILAVVVPNSPYNE